jgi:hypothetical protein
MFYRPQTGDTRYRRKIVLFPINIRGIRYAWEIVYVKQRYEIGWYYYDIVSKKEYLKWKKGT